MNDIRWKQRFQNFEKAWQNFVYVIEELNSNPDSKIHKMAFIQAYEMVFELGWKTMKDYLYLQGVQANYPREAIKEAYVGEIIKNGEMWAEMLDDRDLLSHTYDEERANFVVNEIKNKYYPAIEQVYSYFKERL